MEEDKENSRDLYDEQRTRARDVGMRFRHLGDQMHHERCQFIDRKRSRTTNILRNPYLGIITTNIYKACFL